MVSLSLSLMHLFVFFLVEFFPLVVIVMKADCQESAKVLTMHSANTSNKAGAYGEVFATSSENIVN